MAFAVIFTVISILSGIPTLIRYLNRDKVGIKTDAVVSRIGRFPGYEDDGYYYYYVKFTDEKGKVREHWAYRSITNNDYTVGQTVRVIFFPGHYDEVTMV
jgi:hypothetical protein